MPANQVFIKTPWAQSGLKNTIPDAADPITGRAGWDQGYSPTNMTPVTAGGIPPFGQDMNGILNVLSQLLHDWQVESFPTWIPSSSNGGVPYPYLKTAIVRYSPDGIAPYDVWMNTIANNATSPSVANGWVLMSGLASDPTETTRGSPLLATQAQAETGANNTAMMSPLRVVQLIRSAVAAASETLRGVLRIGTLAEVKSGTADDLSVTPKKLKDAGLWPLGFAQLWSDQTSSRLLNVTYTNTTGRSIQVYVSGSGTGASDLQIVVDGLVICGGNIYSSNNQTANVGATVPAGSTYRYQVTNSGALNNARVTILS